MPKVALEAALLWSSACVSRLLLAEWLQGELTTGRAHELPNEGDLLPGTPKDFQRWTHVRPWGVSSTPMS